MNSTTALRIEEERAVDVIKSDKTNDSLVPQDVLKIEVWISCSTESWPVSTSKAKKRNVARQGVSL